MRRDVIRSRGGQRPREDREASSSLPAEAVALDDDARRSPMLPKFAFCVAARVPCPPWSPARLLRPPCPARQSRSTDRSNNTFPGGVRPAGKRRRAFESRGRVRRIRFVCYRGPVLFLVVDLSRAVRARPIETDRRRIGSDRRSSRTCRVASSGGKSASRGEQQTIRENHGQSDHAERTRKLL